MSEATLIEGRIESIPMAYHPEFFRDPLDSMLKYGCMPQRARAPWFTNVNAITECMSLPDQVCGPAAEAVNPKLDYKALVAHPHAETGLLDGLSSNFYAADDGYWHVHIDLALNKKRAGDAAGIALARITGSYLERSSIAGREAYIREICTYEVPFVAQIVAPQGDQIYFSSVTRFILQLKQLRGFNITSFSTDTFGGIGVGQELMAAGLVTAGMEVDEHTGEVHGLPKPFSVDRSPAPYRELLEGVNETRIAIPKYAILEKEMRELESPDRPGFAPDHSPSSSKDTSDAVAGAVGYLAMFGHAELRPTELITVDRQDLKHLGYDIPDIPDWSLDGDDVSFGIEGGSTVAFGLD